MEETNLERAIRLQNGLIGWATNGEFEGGLNAYGELRTGFLADPVMAAKAPPFLRRCRDLNQFWEFIKNEYASYRERREFLWESFRPLLDHLDAGERSPSDEAISASLEGFKAEAVHAAWQKALVRRSSDPEGAITAARSLVESTCKHILDDIGIAYGDADLPKLWAMTAQQLNLLPAQHDHDAFRRILGNCQAVIDGLATIRNRVGDAHGQGRRPVAAKPRHAELAVNLAGTMASFLVATWLDRPSTHALTEEAST